MWKWNMKWYKWLLDRILNERPSKTTDHDWCKLAIWMQVELKKCNDLFKKLPKPTKEQRYGKDIDPWKDGKWPGMQCLRSGSLRRPRKRSEISLTELLPY